MRYMPDLIAPMRRSSQSPCSLHRWSQSSRRTRRHTSPSHRDRLLDRRKLDSDLVRPQEPPHLGRGVRELAYVALAALSGCDTIPTWRGRRGLRPIDVRPETHRTPCGSVGAREIGWRGVHRNWRVRQRNKSVETHNIESVCLT